MEIVKYKYGEAVSCRECVMALGFFDGVHMGHRDLLAKARELADRLGISLGVFTFPTESAIKAGSERIYSTESKLSLLESAGVDFTVLADFGSISGLSPESFVSDVLIGDLSVKVAASGFNYRFGRGAAGDAKLLSELMQRGGGDALIAGEFKHRGKTVSASLVRDLLSAGDIIGANELLCAPFRISGKVSHGNSVGRTLGFPTVNTDIEKGRIAPGRGVYATALRLGERIYPSITNVGTCPTFSERALHLETYIIDFDGDIYGENIEIYFLDRLRDEIKFSNEKELIMQINIDKNKAISRIGDKTWQDLGPSLQ